MAAFIRKKVADTKEVIGEKTEHMKEAVEISIRKKVVDTKEVIDEKTEHMKEAVEMVRGHRWSKPLSIACAATGGILKGVGLGVPGVGFIGGALCITAKMLRPVATTEEVQERINHMKALLSKETNVDVKKLIQENIEKLEDNMLNPPDEVREDTQEVRVEAMQVLKKNKEYSESINADDMEQRSRLEQVYQLVVDTHYKVKQRQCLGRDYFYRSFLNC